MASLIRVEGIGPVYAEKLKDAGIRSTEALLEAGKSPQGRKALAEKSDIGGKLILEWINHVDLFRIKGVFEEYADLLEEAGVDTVPELAQRNAENLYAKVVATNQEKKLVRRLPTSKQVTDWIQQAKVLPRIVTY